MDQQTISSYAAATVRLLQSEEEMNFAMYDAASKVTQVFSGIFFAGLAIWLSFTNGTKLSFIQQAALEKRLTVCCFLGVYVGAFSAFFNFFQLTEVDDFMLARPTSFTLDFARPLEWIMTCPLMQLSLVLMGGSRIPENRRWQMPGLSVAVLSCGTASMLASGFTVFVCYGAGLCIACVMFYLNRQQILEHSNGEECLMYGDSEFRKASVLLIVTWVPFPTFYALSPEGFGLINNVLLVSVGWAFLNIVSKFTFIFYIQRVKDNYCSRLKAKREFYSAQNSVVPMPMMPNPDGSITPTPGAQRAQKAQGELGAIVVETMTFLGMAQNSDRFLRLLSHCEIISAEQLENISQEECVKLQLPWDLVAAVQKRLRVFRLEMQDGAEAALEKGELHYQMDEFRMQDVASKLQAHAAQNQQVGTGTATPAGGMISVQAMEMNSAQMSRLEDMMVNMQRQQEMFQVEVMRELREQKVQSNGADVQRAMEVSVQQAMMSLMRSKEQEVEGGLKQRLDEVTSLVHDRVEQFMEASSLTMRNQMKDTQEILDHVRVNENASLAKLEDRLKYATDEIAKVSDLSKRTLQDAAKDVKAASDGSGMRRQQEDLERSLVRKIDEQTSKLFDRNERMTDHLRGCIQSDVTTIVSRTDVVNEAVKEAHISTKDHLNDLRRIVTTVLENVSSNAESSHLIVNRVAELRGAFDASIDRLVGPAKGNAFMQYNDQQNSDSFRDYAQPLQQDSMQYQASSHYSQNERPISAVNHGADRRDDRRESANVGSGQGQGPRRAQLRSQGLNILGA